MKKVIVFDMDDTLYDEYEYVKSGFNAVSSYLSEKYKTLNKDEIYEWMWTREQNVGRGSIFDDLLREYNLFDENLVERCIEVYRFHEPNITLPNLTIETLDSLKSYPLYLVTDGHITVQENKIKSLNLNRYMKKCIPTYKNGIDKGKPSPYYFEKIKKWEKVGAEDIVYIGDNPTKDFIGIKPLGFKTIRILTGQHKEKNLSSEYEADIKITDLSDLMSSLVKIWPNFKEKVIL